MSDSSKSSGQSSFSALDPQNQGRSAAARRFESLILSEYSKANDERLVATVDLRARAEAHQAFRKWFDLLSAPSSKKLTESKLEQEFNSNCLSAQGYRSFMNGAPDGSYSLAVKHELPGAKEADVVLGHFPNASDVTPHIRVVVELKGPNVRLDANDLKRLRDEYRDTIEPVKKIAAEIAQLERQIADLVHQA